VVRARNIPLRIPASRLVDNAIARLRKKIEPDIHQPQFIHTVRGDVYTLTPEGRTFVPAP
jgi:DNA-binding response OmpR family regulator